MPLQPKQFLVRLAILADADDLCELLYITSEDIIERFDDKIEEHMEELQEIFDIDIDQGEDTDG
jgi:hypothetical protein|tara:strand:- start:352 stop:543 length:192 start_codon:yes stop_codon:yes gene_type:complete